MTPGAPQPVVPDTRPVLVRLTVAGRPLDVRVNVPTGPTPPSDFLALYRAIVDRLVTVSVRTAERQGESVSCRAGCGACCRQLVPVSALEARELMKLVERLPEPRRSVIRQRFADARARLGAKAPHLLDRMLYPADYPGESPLPVAREYFRLGIACPFLEDESCSIHPDRPLACRQHMVTSPAELCADISPQMRQLDIIGGHAFPWVPVWERTPGGRPVEHLAMILAPEFVERHPQEQPDRPGTEILGEFLTRMQQRGRWGAPTGPGPAPAAQHPPHPQP